MNLTDMNVRLKYSGIKAKYLNECDTEILVLWDQSKNQWWCQEFQNRGCSPGAVEYVGSGDCFNAPNGPVQLPLGYSLAVRVECIACQ